MGYLILMAIVFLAWKSSLLFRRKLLAKYFLKLAIKGASDKAFGKPVRAWATADIIIEDYIREHKDLLRVSGATSYRSEFVAAFAVLEAIKSKHSVQDKPFLMLLFTTVMEFVQCMVERESYTPSEVSTIEVLLEEFMLLQDPNDPMEKEFDQIRHLLRN